MKKPNNNKKRQDKMDELISDLGLDKHIPYEIQQDEFMLNVFKKGLETLMKGELELRLGYGHSDREAKKGKNKRNGYRERPIDTSAGRIPDLKVPRDRDGSFKTKLFGERETKMERVENLIIGMYAKGTSTEDIADLLNSIYRFKLNPQTVSNVVKKIEDEFNAWRNKPLSSEYAFVFIDALHQKIRRGTVDNEAIYVLVGVNMQGIREFLGIYNLGGCESSNVWQECYEDIKRRGVERILLAVMDGLSGNEEAFRRVFPAADVQDCVVHQVRGQLAKTKPKHKAEMTEDMKKIYNQSKLEYATKELELFTKKWLKLYPSITKSWNDKFYKLMKYLDYPESIRTAIYTTNWIERMNREFRRVLKNKSSLPTSESALKLMFLKIRDLERKYGDRTMTGFQTAQYDLVEMMEKRYAN
jgi:transposase-like protein